MGLRYIQSTKTPSQSVGNMLYLTMKTMNRIGMIFCFHEYLQRARLFKPKHQSLKRSLDGLRMCHQPEMVKVINGFPQLQYP